MLVYTVTDFEDEIYSDDNYLEIKENNSKNKRTSENIFSDENDKNENKKENKIYMVNDIDGFIKLINKK
jgi:hypothetical protein